MKNLNVSYTEKPKEIEVERLPDGYLARIRRNIREETGEETAWMADEYIVKTVREVTAEEVTASVDAWIAMAEEEPEDKDEPTLDEQVKQMRADIDFLLMMEGEP